MSESNQRPVLFRDKTAEISGIITEQAVKRAFVHVARNRRFVKRQVSPPQGAPGLVIGRAQFAHGKVGLGHGLSLPARYGRVMRRDLCVLC